MKTLLTLSLLLAGISAFPHHAMAGFALTPAQMTRASNDEQNVSNQLLSFNGDRHYVVGVNLTPSQRATLETQMVAALTSALKSEQDELALFQSMGVSPSGPIPPASLMTYQTDDVAALNQLLTSVESAGTVNAFYGPTGNINGDAQMAAGILAAESNYLHVEDWKFITLISLNAKPLPLTMAYHLDSVDDSMRLDQLNVDQILWR